MSDFNWKRKERVQEQLKFFGAKKTRFISCYAKKPRIKVKLKPKFEPNQTNQLQMLANIQANLSAQTGLRGSALGGGLMGQGIFASQQAAQASALAQAQAQQQEMLAGLRSARGQYLAGLKAAAGAGL